MKTEEIAVSAEERQMLMGMRERQRRENGNPVLQIKAECTQLGLAVDASQDGGKTWVCVQLTPYKERESPTVMQYSTCIDPGKDRAEYFAELDKRGIVYRAVRG